MKHFAYISLCLALCLLFAGCTRTRISSFRVETPEAPEVEGVHAYMEPHSATYRFSGSVTISPKETMAVSGSYVNYSSDSLMQQSRSFSANGYYEFGGSDVNASFDWFGKASVMLIGFGVGYDDGIYHHLKVGFNTSVVEAGVYLGLYHQYTTLEINGSTCDTWPCSERDNWGSMSETNTDFYTNLFYGLYASIIIDDFFMSYNLSIYNPSVSGGGESVSSPDIYSHYIKGGYRISKHWEVNAGLIMSFVDPDYRHFAANVGAAFYL
ncbi:MAG: hypothetical protein IK012_06340 [Fibrobacter sp.]|uniref:hypothetical protein n=1 Tax=Fibrobacter sp. TaxID=35828 RepID=UPI0025C1F614|nr:hypothetical protein [Fibrobacter sp.]MBR4784857.1 hypothetical protein [Fibrobacter sp.]